MIKKIKYQIFGFILLLFSFSCVSKQDKGSNVDSSKFATSIEKEDLTEHKPKNPELSRIITYNKLIGLGEKYNYILNDGTANFKYMFPTELRLLRNEIFARKGYIFSDPELKKYFENKLWYNPRYKVIDSIRLDKTHKCLIDSIIRYEKINKDLKESDLKQQFINIVSSFPNSKINNYKEIPICLFNRFMPEKINKDYSSPIYYGGFLIEYLDTLSSGNIIMTCYTSACSAETCQNFGDIIICDNKLTYLDSEGINCNDFAIEKLSNDSLYYSYTESYGDNRISETIYITKFGKIEHE